MPRPVVRSTLFSTLALLAGLMAAQAQAQDTGGLRLAPGIGAGPKGLAQPLPFVTPPFVSAHDIQRAAMPADRSAQHQAMITRLRGDAGYLGGFAFGTPQALSRQPVAVAQDDPGIGLGGDWPGGDWQGGNWQGGNSQGGGGGTRHGRRPIIIQNQGPLAVTVGNGNVVQQQYASGPGPIAQQQIATGTAAGGGATNLVTPAGNILQVSPGAAR